MKKNGLIFKFIMSLLGGELHLNLCVKKGSHPSEAGTVFSEQKARKWLWIAIGGFRRLVQIYFVRELLAALMPVCRVFIICAMWRWFCT